jgi:hypothetical protein
MPIKLVFAALAMLAGVAVACQGATNPSLLKVAGIGPLSLLYFLLDSLGNGVALTFLTHTGDFESCFVLK